MRIPLAALAAISLLSAAEVKLGKPLTMKQPVAIETLLARPGDYLGKTAVAEGKFTRLELTREQAAARAEEEARERGVKFDAASVKSVTIYQIECAGAGIGR